MEKYSVGPDELSDSELDEIGTKNAEGYCGVVWVVYSYGYEDYNGGGIMVALHGDGRLSITDLSHCSCYGPTDDFPANLYTVSEFLDRQSSVLTAITEAGVVEKVRELLGEQLCDSSR